MSELIADLAMNDQVILYDPEGNVEAGTRYILQKHKVGAKDFIDSYKYYSVNNSMKKILTNAQKILLEKYPEAKKKIENKPNLEQIAPEPRQQ